MTKLNSQDKLYAFAAKNGWTLDPTATINTHARRYGQPDFAELPAEEQAQYIKQNPNVFTKAATDGGRWQVSFDYQVRYQNCRLKGIALRYFGADGAEQRVSILGERSYYADDRILPIKLTARNAATYCRGNGFLFDVLGDYDTPIAKRVEKLLTGTETALWLAAELQHESNVASKKAQEASRIDRELRDRPLPGGFVALKKIAREISFADGKTDVVDLLSRLRETIATVEANLIDPVG